LRIKLFLSPQSDHLVPLKYCTGFFQSAGVGTMVAVDANYDPYKDEELGQKEKMLRLLTHAANCKKPVNTCPNQHCKAGKMMLKHLMQCKDTTQGCNQAFCAPAKLVLKNGPKIKEAAAKKAAEDKAKAKPRNPLNRKRLRPGQIYAQEQAASYVPVKSVSKDLRNSHLLRPMSKKKRSKLTRKSMITIQESKYEDRNSDSCNDSSGSEFSSSSEEGDDEISSASEYSSSSSSDNGDDSSDSSSSSSSSDEDEEEHFFREAAFFKTIQRQRLRRGSMSQDTTPMNDAFLPGSAAGDKKPFVPVRIPSQRGRPEDRESAGLGTQKSLLDHSDRNITAPQRKPSLTGDPEDIIPLPAAMLSDSSHGSLEEYDKNPMPPVRQGSVRDIDEEPRRDTFDSQLLDRVVAISDSSESYSDEGSSSDSSATHSDEDGSEEDVLQTQPFIEMEQSKKNEEQESMTKADGGTLAKEKPTKSDSQSGSSHVSDPDESAANSTDGSCISSSSCSSAGDILEKIVERAESRATLSVKKAAKESSKEQPKIAAKKEGMSNREITAGKFKPIATQLQRKQADTQNKRNALSKGINGTSKTTTAPTSQMGRTTTSSEMEKGGAPSKIERNTCNPKPDYIQEVPRKADSSKTLAEMIASRNARLKELDLPKQPANMVGFYSLGITTESLPEKKRLENKMPEKKVEAQDKIWVPPDISDFLKTPTADPGEVDTSINLHVPTGTTVKWQTLDTEEKRSANAEDDDDYLSGIVDSADAWKPPKIRDLPSLKAENLEMDLEDWKPVDGNDKKSMIRTHRTKHPKAKNDAKKVRPTGAIWVPPNAADVAKGLVPSDSDSNSSSGSDTSSSSSARNAILSLSSQPDEGDDKVKIFFIRHRKGDDGRHKIGSKSSKQGSVAVQPKKTTAVSAQAPKSSIFSLLASDSDCGSNLSNDQTNKPEAPPNSTVVAKIVKKKRSFLDDSSSDEDGSSIVSSDDEGHPWRAKSSAVPVKSTEEIAAEKAKKEAEAEEAQKEKERVARMNDILEQWKTNQKAGLAGVVKVPDRSVSNQGRDPTSMDDEKKESRPSNTISGSCNGSSYLKSKNDPVLAAAADKKPQTTAASTSTETKIHGSTAAFAIWHTTAGNSKSKTWNKQQDTFLASELPKATPTRVESPSTKFHELETTEIRFSISNEAPGRPSMPSAVILSKQLSSLSSKKENTPEKQTMPILAHRSGISNEALGRPSMPSAADISKQLSTLSSRKENTAGKHAMPTPANRPGKPAMPSAAVLSKQLSSLSSRKGERSAQSRTEPPKTNLSQSALLNNELESVLAGRNKLLKKPDPPVAASKGATMDPSGGVYPLSDMCKSAQLNNELLSALAIRKNKPRQQFPTPSSSFQKDPQLTISSNANSELALALAQRKGKVAVATNFSSTEQREESTTPLKAFTVPSWLQQTTVGSLLGDKNTLSTANSSVPTSREHRQERNKKLEEVPTLASLSSSMPLSVANASAGGTIKNRPPQSVWRAKRNDEVASAQKQEKKDSVPSPPKITRSAEKESSLATSSSTKPNATTNNKEEKEPATDWWVLEENPNDWWSGGTNAALEAVVMAALGL